MEYTANNHHKENVYQDRLLRQMKTQRRQMKTQRMVVLILAVIGLALQSTSIALNVTSGDTYFMPLIAFPSLYMIITLYNVLCVLLRPIKTQIR
jgi:hypothetical protein